MRTATTGRWAMVQYSESHTGALAAFPTANLTKSNGRGMAQGSSGVTVAKSGLYLALVYAYVTNIAAGGRAEVQLMVNNSNLLSAMIYVPTAGGTAQGSSHAVLTLAAGDRVTLQRYHSDTGSSRAMSGELFLQELI